MKPKYGDLKVLWMFNVEAPEEKGDSCFVINHSKALMYSKWNRLTVFG